MTRKVILSALILTWIVIALPVPAIAENMTGTAVPFSTIALGQSSAIRESTQLVVRDRTAWRALWRRHGGAARSAPAVDFARDMVVAVFGGESSEPRRVAVVRIIRDPKRLVVWHMDRAMKSPNGGWQPFQSPFHIVRLARSSLPVSFTRVKSFPPASQP